MEAIRNFDIPGLKKVLKWDGNSDPPKLPPEVIRETTARYLEAHKLITRREL